MTDCLFCKIVAGDIKADIVHEDEHCIAFKDINPKAATHLLVIPRQHICNLYDIKPEHDHLLTHLIKTIPMIAKAQNLDNGFRAVTNTGEGGGQEVFHLHFHILGGGPLSPL
ncbi:histidine triad nucleotide-binding protein [Zooshikella ganghwensis]|uniref:histidine triad nucleotide-binding protein n=1 Tax=Zooshikella ganghwensis TaxID=202772 RepID=UPI000423B022|nr:histidine triad nucleotide-binding protein [Zooshikella ganghwensis]